MTDPRRRAGRLRVADAWGEALHGAVGRPLRTLVPASAIALGVAIAVVTIGVRDTSDAALAARLARIRPNVIVVTPTEGGTTGLTSAVVDRIARTPGVVAVGERRTVADQVPVTRSPGVEGSTSRILGLGTSALRGLRSSVEGRTFDRFAESRGEGVAVVTRDLAQTLQLGGLGSRPTIVVSGVPLTVIGVVPELSGTQTADAAPGGSVIVPLALLDRLLPAAGTTVTRDLVVMTERGQTAPVIEILSRSLNQSEPVVSFRDEADTGATVRGAQDEQGRAGLFLALLVSAAAFASIFVTTLGSVTRRIPEFGLRRSVGARPVHIGTQVVLEAVLVGTVASVVGVALGIIGVSAVALARGWAPVLHGGILVGTVLAGAVLTVVASAYPAVRATTVDPIRALGR